MNNNNFNQQQQNFLFQQQQLLQNQARQQQQMGYQPNDWRLMTTEATRRAVVDHLFQAVFNEMPEGQKTEQERQKVLLMAGNFENDEFQKAATQQIYVQNIRDRMAAIQQKIRQSNTRPIQPIQQIPGQGLTPQQQQQYLIMAQMNPQYAQLLQQQQNLMTPHLQQLIAAQGRPMMNPAHQFQQRAQANIQPVWQPVAPQLQPTLIKPIDLTNTGAFTTPTQPPPKKLTLRQQKLLLKQNQKSAAKAAPVTQTQPSQKDPAILREIETLTKNRVMKLIEVPVSKPEAKVTIEMILELKPIYDNIDNLIYDMLLAPDQGDKENKIDKIIGIKKLLTAQYESIGQNKFYLNKSLCTQMKALLIKYKQINDMRPKPIIENPLYSVPSPQESRESIIEKEQQRFDSDLDPILKRDFGTDKMLVQSFEQEQIMLPGFGNIKSTDIKSEKYSVRDHAEILFGPCKVIRCDFDQVEGISLRERLLCRIPEQELTALKTGYGLDYSINLLGANTSVMVNVGEIILAVSIPKLKEYLSQIMHKKSIGVLVLDMINGIDEEKKKKLNVLIKNGAVIKTCVDFLIGASFMDR